MKAMSDNNIDLNRWVIRRIEEIPFGRPAYFSNCGWLGHLLDLDNNTFEGKNKKFKGKLYPTLSFLKADFTKDESHLGNYWKKISECSQSTKDLFLKFYHEGMETVVLNVTILAKPYDFLSKCKLSYYEKKYLLLPLKPIKNYPKQYEFLLENYWVKNNIYEAPSEIIEGNKSFPFSQFQEDWTDLILAIRQNYCLLQNYLVMDEIKFMNILETLTSLADDTIEHPFIVGNNFHNKIPFYTKYLNPKDCELSGMTYSRWVKNIPKDEKTGYAFRILDSRDYLNNFLKHFNYGSMKDSLELFLIKMYESFGDALIEKKELSKCAFCGNYFLFLKGKKYCTLRSEGKDCGTPARNKRYYTKHKAKILPRARTYARKYRAE